MAVVVGPLTRRPRSESNDILRTLGDSFRESVACLGRKACVGVYSPCLDTFTGYCLLVVVCLVAGGTRKGAMIATVMKPMLRKPNSSLNWKVSEYSQVHACTELTLEKWEYDVNDIWRSAHGTDTIYNAQIFTSSGQISLHSVRGREVYEL